jgi:hypothetical protein
VHIDRLLVRGGELLAALFHVRLVDVLAAQAVTRWKRGAQVPLHVEPAAVQDVLLQVARTTRDGCQGNQQAQARSCHFVTTFHRSS